MKKFILALILALLSVPPTIAQELLELHHYNSTNSALEGHTTQLLQDRNGVLWVSTWNGLYRFDGYEFIRLKPQAGDGCTMVNDRLRDIWLSDQGDIYCNTDDGTYRFDMQTYRFFDVNDAAELEEAERGFLRKGTRGTFSDGALHFVDPKGLEWQLRNNTLYCMSRLEQPAQPLPLEREAMVRCIWRDNKERVWLTTKDESSVVLLNNQGERQGYLSPDGRIVSAYTPFSHPVYCFFHAPDGHIWMGTKPDGLFRLTETADGRFDIEHIDGDYNPNIYCITSDSRGRIWVATLGGGIFCIEHPREARPTVTAPLPGYPADACQRVRYLHITQDDILLAATTEGLLASKIEDDLSAMRFRRHVREPLRPNSLSSNAVMDMVQTPSGQLFVSTETGGICEITSPDLLADTLSFRHYCMDNNLLPTDMVVGMTQGVGESLLIVCLNQLVNLNVHQDTYENLGHHFFYHHYQFSEARPLLLGDDRWLLGHNSGALLLPQSLAHRSNYQPPLMLTAISVQNRQKDLAVQHTDTLRLLPPDRTVTVHFAAIDYTDPDAINYQFRLGNDSTRWNNIGHDHSVTLLDLDPGTYQLHLRSTNAEGQWTDNIRTLTIIVEPTFWETGWAIALLVVLGLLFLAAVGYTLLYIRRIRRKQQEALQAYLNLLELQKSATHTPSKEKEFSAADPFMQQVLNFVEKNIGNSDADISQMAEACAVSRSVLQRRTKQLMGLTPADFLREARIKHACRLFTTTDQTVAEVAYHCGFNDPKYFSRCFKQSVGMSPTEYKATPANA
ncbi:MAG: helix-turn-helix domain-containing protein [Prevotella sp.]|nr:helix-turn-helix domain-containing protein [Prevotella sp.]